MEAVERGALAPLLRLLSSPNIHVILAATAALRNISIHPRTEARLVQAGFLQPLIFLMSIDRAPGRPQFVVPTKADGASADAQARMLLDIRCHAVSCLRNMDAPPALQSEMAACLAVLALSEMVRDQITKTSAVGILIGLVTSSESVDVQGNCAAALGNMAASMAACQQFTQRWPEAASYLQALVTSNNPTFIYIAVWTLYHLAKHSTSCGRAESNDFSGGRAGGAACRTLCRLIHGRTLAVGQGVWHPSHSQRTPSTPCRARLGSCRRSPPRHPTPMSTSPSWPPKHKAC